MYPSQIAPGTHARNSQLPTEALMNKIRMAAVLGMVATLAACSENAVAPVKRCVGHDEHHAAGARRQRSRRRTRFASASRSSRGTRRRTISARATRSSSRRTRCAILQLELRPGRVGQALHAGDVVADGERQGVARQERSCARRLRQAHSLRAVDESVATGSCCSSPTSRRRSIRSSTFCTARRRRAAATTNRRRIRRCSRCAIRSPAR